LDILKMSKNQNFKILFDEKLHSLFFHGSGSGSGSDGIQKYDILYYSITLLHNR